MVRGLRDITQPRGGWGGGQGENASEFLIGGLAGKLVVASPEQPSSFGKNTWVDRCSGKEGKLGQFKFNVVFMNGLVNGTQYVLCFVAMWNDGYMSIAVLAQN